jgi:hypothetical protein
MSEISFELKPVDEKPKRTYRKGSKYVPILDIIISNLNFALMYNW